ncbi:MAG TPA: FMN-binding protein [Firmicutes bacterium]|nr:FMN-binding protein [Bacillota bacterium]
MKKKLLKVLAVLAVLAAIAFGAMWLKIEANEKKLATLPVAEVDVAEIPDGVYRGSFSFFPVSAEVEVTVANHAISGIKLLEHMHARGAAAEVIVEKVKDAQSLEVDLVSGATFSSKVILKAIEDALVEAAAKNRQK